MLDVHSLQNFEFMNNFHLVAGNTGVYRNVTNVVILDYEGIEEDYHGFHEGDFVITNLMFAKRHPERIYNSFKALISIGVSAFAVKTVIFTTLPEEVIALANEKQIPIFLFNDIFIEDVILNITDHLRSSTNFNYNENLIDDILSPSDNSKQVYDLSQSLKIDGNDLYCSAMYLGYKNTIDKFTLQRTVSKLQIQLKHLPSEYNLKLTLYKNGLLFVGLWPASQLDSKSSMSIEKYWTLLIKYLGLSTENFTIGISDKILPVDKLDITIMRCLNAYKYGDNITLYNNIGVQNLFYPVLSDKYIREYLLEVIKKIQPKCNDFESFRKTSTYATLKVCLQADFDMIEAAKLLFQHQNTVRYRLKKLQSTLKIEDETSLRILATYLVQFANAD